MLKIGIVRWRGKCTRHPRFDPYLDGVGAVKGGCERCSTLAEIYQHHQKMIALMRNFAPPASPKRTKPSAASLQTSFFDEAGT